MASGLSTAYAAHIVPTAQRVQGRHRSNVNSNVEVRQWHVTLLISTLAQQEFPIPISFAKQKSLQGHSCTRILLPKKKSVFVS